MIASIGTLSIMVRRIVAMQAGEMMTQMPDQDAEDGSGVTPEIVACQAEAQGRR
jgi:hypothetical protein